MIRFGGRAERAAPPGVLAEETDDSPAPPAT